MKFSVIIPTYHDWERLQKCLKALHGQSFPKGDYEVIVVNNSESAEIPEHIELPNEIQVLHESRPGSYVARNKGVSVAKGDLLAFTDSDCIPDEHWLANAAIYFKQFNCDLLGGRVDIFKGPESGKYGYIYERNTAFPQHKHVPNGRGVTANLFVKKDVFTSVGGFNDEIKSGGDWEFTIKCTENGYSMIYGDDVLVLHPARNVSTILKKQLRLTCGGVLNVKEKYGHGYLRMLGSHIIHGLRKRREYIQKPDIREKIVVFFIDLLNYIYRAAIHSGIALRLIKPERVRE